MSHLTRGAWIEIPQTVRLHLIPMRRTSHEVRGLKYISLWQSQGRHAGRTSHEVRGLKSRIVENVRLLKRRTSHEVYGRSFGVSMNQFRDLHLKSHLTIAFLFTYNNKKGREW